MIGIELGVERADIIPEGGVFYRDGAVSFDLPGELVELFNSDSLAVGVGLDLLDVAAEVADFVEGVPCGHLKFYAVMDVRDFHGDAEEMLLGVGDRDLVANRCVGGSGEEKNKN